MTVIWVCLWGEITPVLVVGGLLLSALVLLAFPLPRLTLGLRPRPLALLWLLVTFLGELVWASLQVAWLSVRPGPAATGTELEVLLNTDHDLVRTLTSEITTLVPGSVITDLDGRRMRVHVIDVHTPEGRAAAVERVLRTERRVMHAFGLEPGPAAAGPAAPGGRP
nr:Na+/H+ antiporter subunit E [Auraticoccus cholistanensis]